MNTYATTPTSLPRQTAIKILAVIGFVALIGTGMWLAVYSTQFVPSVINRIGEATVYLGSVFTPQHTSNNNLSVIPMTPTASTTISFGEASSTGSKMPVKHPTTTYRTKRITTTAGTKEDTVYQMKGSVGTPSLYGLPDFVTTIDAIGYLATTSADSFVASSTVPTGSRPAVRFTIKNIGTNATGPWRFSALIPTQTAYIYQSQPQQSLNPGDSIDYTLGFDQANKGANETISITANFDHAVVESNTNNDSASAQITILGN